MGKIVQTAGRNAFGELPYEEEAMRAHAKEMVFPIGAPDEWFSHLAIEVPGEETSNEWCEPVTDATYKLLK